MTRPATMVSGYVAIIATISLILAGCSTVSVPSASVPNLYLPQVEKRISGLTSAQFPPGEYVPDFQTEAGIYYLASRKLAVNGLGISQALKGGVFIPHSNNPDQTEALWFDNQENGAGVFTAMVSAQTRLYPFKPPIPFTQSPYSQGISSAPAPKITQKTPPRQQPSTPVQTSTRELPIAKRVDDPDLTKIYFYSPYDLGGELHVAPASASGKIGTCPVTGKDFIIP